MGIHRDRQRRCAVEGMLLPREATWPEAIHVRASRQGRGEEVRVSQGAFGALVGKECTAFGEARVLARRGHAWYLQEETNTLHPTPKSM